MIITMKTEEKMRKAFSVLVIAMAAVMMLAVPLMAEDEPEAEGFYVTGKVVSYTAGVSITIDEDGEKISFPIASDCAAPDTLEAGTLVDVEVMKDLAVSITPL